MMLHRNTWNIYSLVQWLTTLIIGTAFILLAALGAGRMAHAAPYPTLATSTADAIRAEQRESSEYHTPQWYREYESAAPDGSRADAGDRPINTDASDRSLNRLERLNSGRADRQAFSRESDEYNPSLGEIRDQVGDRLSDVKESFQEATQRVLEGENNPQLQ